MIKVSVIVPVYNVERYLKRCLDSLVHQTYDYLELILVDDGSTDSSGAICDIYKKQDERIKVIHKENGGVSSARNEALKEVTGDYLMFLDSDDALDLNAIERCVENTENAAWDLVLFGFHMYTEIDGETAFQNDVVYPEEIIATKAQMLSRFSEYYRKGYFNFITDKIIRSSLILDHAIEFKREFDIGGEDGMFILDLADHISHIKVTSDVFYQYYRRTKESVTQLFKAAKFDRYYDRIIRLYTFMQDNNCVDTDYLTELYGMYFLWTYESTFHPSCTLKLNDRFRYMMKTFRKKEIFPGQHQTQRQKASALSSFADYSKSSLIALKLFYQNRVLLLCLWNLFTYIKMR